MALDEATSYRFICEISRWALLPLEFPFSTTFCAPSREPSSFDMPPLHPPFPSSRLLSSFDHPPPPASLLAPSPSWRFSSLSLPPESFSSFSFARWKELPRVRRSWFFKHEDTINRRESEGGRAENQREWSSQHFWKGYQRSMKPVLKTS